ncbi:hypothetical protein [Lysobacter sp. TAB13]|uniref:hypothetical protein n=1 Tax=Lysobacter sp. TAB13 TaxID=3233065 RepID=UPI003F96FEA3
MSVHYFYFADYEILVGGRFIVWGQTTLDYAPAEPGAFDPAELLNRIRAQAANEHAAPTSRCRSGASRDRESSVAANAIFASRNQTSIWSNDVARG